MLAQFISGDFDDLSIAQPGLPRTIPDLDLTVIEDAVNAADGSAASALLGKEIAIKLSEPKVGFEFRAHSDPLKYYTSST